MAYYCEQVDLQITELPYIEISDSDEDNSTSSPANDTEKEESPEPSATPKPKPSIFTSSLGLKKKKNGSSGKKRVKRIPCPICTGRFGTQASLDLHMKVHWNVFDKMNALLERITNKVKDEDMINRECKCSRCIYESRGKEKPYEITKNFCCQVCDLSFFTANKLSKHMDKHREIYFKMKKLEEENHFLFFDRPAIMSQCEYSIFKCRENEDNAYHL